MLLQRLATSKYASTGDRSGTARAARPTMSSRGDAPVGANLDAPVLNGDVSCDGPGAKIGSSREGLVTTDYRPLSGGFGTPRRVRDGAAQQRRPRAQRANPATAHLP